MQQCLAFMLEELIGNWLQFARWYGNQFKYRFEMIVNLYSIIQTTFRNKWLNFGWASFSNFTDCLQHAIGIDKQSVIAQLKS